MEKPITASSLLQISQITLRDRWRDENRGIKRWLSLNLQTIPVTMKTYERFSSPGMLKILTGAKSRLERINKERLPTMGAPNVMQRTDRTP